MTRTTDCVSHPDISGEADSELATYRLSSPAEVAALLRELQSKQVQLNLSAPGGRSYTSQIWALDAEDGLLSFAADPRDPQLQSVLEAEEVTALGYVDNIKVQFDVRDVVLVHGTRASALNAAYPSEVFRFQRRENYRARPLLHTVPIARMRHPMIPEMELALRILDVSIGGCALLRPDNVPAFDPGVLINQVQIHLNLDTRFSVSLQLHHITSITADSHGSRLGCQIHKLSADARLSLQRYIDQTQKLHRLMALN